MSDQAASANSTESTAKGLPTSQDLAQLCSAGKTISPQELKELTAQIKTFEEIARLEDRLKALENRKRPAPCTRESTIGFIPLYQPEPELEPEPRYYTDPEAAIIQPIRDSDTDIDLDQDLRISEPN